MCDGVYYTLGESDTRYFFPNPRATLPVRETKGRVVLIPWGRRKEQAGKLPLGGCARREAIHAGHWDRYFPKPARLCVKSFMVKDFEGNSHWYDLTRGQYLQGLLASEGSEQRVYIVTIEPEMPDAQHATWPRIVAEPGQRVKMNRIPAF